MCAVLTFACGNAVLKAASTSPLFARGYTVLLASQQVSLEEKDFPFGEGWVLQLAPGVRPDEVAVETLREDLRSRFGIALAFGNVSRCRAGRDT
jgi:hypothetical protein